MTIDEAIEVLQQDIPCEQDTDLIEALEMAIKALKQEPCEDAISRAKAMTEIMMNTNIREHLDGNLYIKVADAVQVLRDLQPIKQETVTEFADRCRECGKMRTGHWIVKKDCEGKTRKCICDRCGYETGKYTWKNPNYCAECGAKMEVEQND